MAVGHPFDTIKVRLQTEGAGGRFKGPLVRMRCDVCSEALIMTQHALSVTVRTEGVRGLYKGAFPPLVRPLQDAIYCRD